MNELKSLLSPAINLLNRQINAKKNAKKLCGTLNGKSLGIQLTETSLILFCTVTPDGVIIQDHIENPDVVISGSLYTLANLLTNTTDDALYNGSISLDGDAQIAKKFQQLLKYAKPDLEEELSTKLGDGVAHGIGDFLKSINSWRKKSTTIMGNNISEFLQEESRSLPSKYEIEIFQNDVNKLRDDVDRLESRIEHRKKTNK